MANDETIRLTLRIVEPEPEIIKYTSDNRHSGTVFLFHYPTGETRSELFAYFPNGRECLHSFSSNVKSFEALREFVDGLPDFFEIT